MFRSARIRLTLLLGSILVFLYIVTAGTIYLLMVRLTVNDENSLLMSSAKPLTEQVSTALNHGRFPEEFVNLNALEQLFPRLSTIVLRDAMGGVLADTNSRVVKQLPYDPAIKLQTLYLPTTHRWVRLLTIHLSNSYGQAEGGLQLALDISQDLASLASLRSVVLEVGILGAIAAVLAGFYASDRALQPIAKSWRRQQQFAADASHELRTPLTVVQANLDVVLGHGQETVLDNLEWLSNARVEIGRLGKLIDELLTLAREDSHQVLLQVAVVDLAEIVREVCELFGILATAKDIQLELDPELAHVQPSDYALRGDANRLRQLAIILIDNAIQYSTAGGRVQVSLRRKRNVIQFSVADNGMGMEKADMRKVFDRFYRADAARERSTGGTGLGLAIAKWIVTMHNGKVHVSSERGKGSTFTIMLPAQRGRRL